MREAIDRALAELHDTSDPESFDRLDALISSQPYRLSSWKVAAEEINYRRFFDVNTLAAIRMELPEVFEATHRLLRALIQARAVDGVRIDHIDGLANPLEYLRTLQASAAGALGTPAEKFATYLLVENPRAGREAAQRLAGARHDGLRVCQPGHRSAGRPPGRARAHRGLQSLRRTATALPRNRVSEQETRHAAFAGQRSQCARAPPQPPLREPSLVSRFHRQRADHGRARDHRLLSRVSHVSRARRTARRCRCARYQSRARRGARRRNPALDRTVFEFLRDVLLPPEPNPHPVDEALRREFVLKFQQCTSPIAAKGVEDTAFYQYHRLIALNEVGGEPGDFGATSETFHRQNAARLAEFPHSMLATSTHDTKRSEDVRARLVALSEMPREWAQALRRWHTLNRKHRREIEGEWAPDHHEEALLYQTLLGSWPLEPLNDTTRPAYIQRIQEYMTKALHEAKVNSSWIQPNENWDNAVREFVATILQPGPRNRFLATFEPLAERLAPLGAINSLTQTTLKLTVPGMPDFYQGTELWDFSLVDPDNRRLPDYAERQRLLASLTPEVPLASLVEHWRDGRIKMVLIHTLLNFRRRNPALFAEGSYTPVPVSGALAESVVAFERTTADASLLVVVPRFISRVGFPPLGERWGETALELATAHEWVDLLTGRRHSGRAKLPLSEILADFPVAMLAAA